MKKSVLIASLVLSSAWGWCARAAQIDYSSDATISDTLTLSEDTTINVAQGVTVTYAASIEGAYKVTKAGMGTLVLAVQNADFTGGLILQEGYLKTTHAEALGSGPIEFNARSTSTTNQLWIAAANTTVNQDVTFTKNGFVNDSGTYASGAVAAFAPIRITAEGVTFNGNLTSAVNTGIFAKKAGTVTFNGTVTTANKKFSPWVQTSSDVMVFKSKVDTGTASFSVANRDFNGTVELWSPENLFGYLFISHFRVFCRDENVLGSATVQWSNVNRTDGEGRVDMNGYDQTIAACSWSSSTKPGAGEAGTPFLSTQPATLTVTKGGTEHWMRFGGAVSVVYSPTANATFACRERTHETTGSVTVRNGTLAFTGAASLKNVGAVHVEGGTLNMNVTSVNCLASVTNVTVAGQLSFASTAWNPFACEDRVALDVAEGGKLILPEEVQLTVTSFSFGSTTLGEGHYTSANCSAIEGAGTVNVIFRSSPADAIDVTWTAGGGEDKSLSTDANWDNAANRPTASAIGPRPVFASAGTEAVLDAVSLFNGMTFTQTAGFAITTNSPTAYIRLAGPVEGVTVSSVDVETRCTNTIAAPVELIFNQVVQPGSKSTIAFTGGLTGANVGFTMQGARLSELKNDYATNGCVILENPRFTGPINHTQGGGWLILRGDIGQPNDTSAVTVDFGRYKNGSNKNDGWTELGHTRWEGVTCYKKVTTQGGGQQAVTTGGRKWCYFGAGTTNVFKKPVTQMCSTGIVAENDAVVIFEDGYTDGIAKGGAYLDGSNDSNHPATYIFKGAMSLASADREVQAGGAVRHVFMCTNNYVRYYYYVGSYAVLEFREKDYAFHDTRVYFGGGGAKMDLNGTKQRFNDVQNRKNGNGTLSGVYPSTLEIMKGQPNAACCSTTNFRPQVTGWVGLKMSGDGYFLLTNRTYQSYGDITAAAGTLELAKNANWPNGTNVTVCGTGTLKLGSSTVFTGTHAVLHVADQGKLDLASGITQVFNEAYATDAEGVERRIKPGVYSASHLDAEGLLAGHFVTGSLGAIRIRGTGTMLLFR